MIIVLQSSFISAQTINPKNRVYDHLLNDYMSNYPLSNIQKIYTLSNVYPAAKDSLNTIIEFIDQKIEDGDVFSETDKYNSSSYGLNLNDIKNGQITSIYSKINLWAYITSHLNIVSDDLYPSKKICQILEKTYLSLTHKERIIYIKKYGHPSQSFIHLLFEGEHKQFKKIMNEKFDDNLYSGCLNCVINNSKESIKNTLIKYNGVSKEEVDNHPKLKQFYISVLNYLEWDNNDKKINKILLKTEKEFGNDPDFVRYKNLIKSK